MMKRWIWLAGLFLALTSLVAACGPYGGTAPAAGPTPTGNEVVMKSIAFQPQKLEVEVGTTVTWRNQDGFPHTATSGTNRAADGLFDSGNIGGGKTFNFTFDKPETYAYFCGIHQGMEGTVVVK